MKKNFIFGIALAVLFVLGFGSAKAQSENDLPELTPEVTDMVNQIVDKYLEDPERANSIMEKKLFKKIRNSRDQLVAVGRIFVDKKMYPFANMCATRAMALASADNFFVAEEIPVLMLKGDVCQLAGKHGEAGSNYEQILSYVDSTYVPAIKKTAKMYKYTNPYIAIEYFQKIKRIDPTNAEADRDMGDIYFELKDHVNAADNYGNYLKNEKDTAFVYAVERYATSLYGCQKFQECYDYAQKTLEEHPKNLILRRMLFFSALALEDEFTASTAMNYIDSGEYPDSALVFSDYLFAGLFANKNQIYSKAIGYLHKAVDKYENSDKEEKAQSQAYKELASAYSGNKEYAKAVENQKTYLGIIGEDALATDFLPLATYCYFASQDTLDTNRMNYVTLGDSMCAKVIELAPDSYMGYQWRARVNNTNDKVPNDTVKSWYEKTVEVIGDKDDAAAKRVKKEAYQYFLWYAYEKDEANDMYKYSNEVLMLDPNNQLANAILDYLTKINFKPTTEQ